MNDAALFISTLNEIEALPKVFDRIPRSAFDEIYALDGGSTDGTVAFFRSHGIPVIQPVKKGAIFTTGAKLAKSNHLVYFAPDGNENPDDIARLLAKLKEGYDMVTGSRFMKGSRNEEDNQVFALRKWVNKAFTLLVRLRWGGKLTDTINGFRAVRRACVLDMALDPTGFDIEFQMSIRALKRGYKVCEIPTVEGNRLGGQSKAFSFPTGWLMLKRYMKELFSR
jgi:glycosyltransferase involved in cell wall biosynthesis